MSTETRIYSEAAERAIRSEAGIWRYGNVESARRSYDQLVTWAQQLTREQRELHKWGAWHANDLLKMAAIGEVQREQPAEPASQTVRMTELRPGDVYAMPDGTPVLDDLASHGGVPVGAIPRPFVAPVPLTVARVVPSDHPAWPAPHWVYVEASNGHGGTVRADAKTRIVARQETQQ